MKILNCSKSTLLRIKKQLTENGSIHEVQQSTSKSGNLANRIYLGLLQDDTVARMVDKSGDFKSDTREGVRFIRGWCLHQRPAQGYYRRIELIA